MPISLRPLLLQLAEPQALITRPSNQPRLTMSVLMGGFTPALQVRQARPIPVGTGETDAVDPGLWVLDVVHPASLCQLLVHEAETLTLQRGLTSFRALRWHSLLHDPSLDLLAKHGHAVRAVVTYVRAAQEADFPICPETAA